MRNAFRRDDPELTNDIQTLYKQCPTLFKRALARSDRNELEQEADAMLDQDEFELDVPPSANESHQDPSIINKIPSKEMANSTHFIQGDSPMPVRAEQLSEHFLQQLRSAYHRDYGKASYWPSYYEKKKMVQYARKVGFNRPPMSPG